MNPFGWGDGEYRLAQEQQFARRHLLLPALHALQHAKGWISPGGLNHAAEVLQVPPAEAYGVATDSAGRVHLAGMFSKTASFGAKNLTASGSGSDLFAARMNACTNSF